MVVKQRSYYRACDAEQNGSKVDWFSMSCWPVRSDGSLKVGCFLYKKCAYLRKKNKSGEQRESTSTKLAVIFEDY